jgi:hypothetical protein
MLLEPQALPRPPKVVLIAAADVLLSDDFAALEKGRDCQPESTLSFAATLPVESYARALFSNTML